MPRKIAGLNGLQFDGAQNYVTLPFIPSTSGFSLAFQVNILSVPSGQAAIINWQDGNVTNGFSIYNYSITGGFWIHVYGGSANVNNGTGNNTALLNQLLNVVLTFVPNSIKAYVNGTLLFTQNPVGMGAATNPLTLGKQAYGGGNANVILYNVVIENTTTPWTQAQVTSYQTGTIPNNGNASWWTMNEGVGTHTSDISGKGNTGVLQGSPVPAWVGQSRLAGSNRVTLQSLSCSILFNNGAGAGVSFPQTNGFPLYNNTAFSIASRFKPYPGALVIYGEGSTADFNTSYYLSVTTGGLLHLFVQTAAGFVSLSSNSTNAAAYNTWNDVVLTDNNGTVHLYINGIEDPKTVSGGWNYTRPSLTVNTSAIGFQIRSGSSLANLFKGSIVDTRLFSRILTASEAAAYHLMGLLNNTSIVGYYPLNEGTGSTAYDISGNGNNGTISNSTYSGDVPFKVRQSVGGNLVYNGNFEFAPPTNTAQTSGSWVNGTSGGTASTVMNPYGYGQTGLFGWILSGQGGSYAALFDSANPHTGNYSMKLSITATNSKIGLTNNGSGVNGMIPVLPSTSYTLSGWAKTTLHSGSATSGGQLGAQEYTGADAFIQTDYALNNLVTTSGWTQYTTVFTTSSTARFVRILAQNYGQDGSATLIMDAWFDDIILVPTTNTKRSLAV